MNIDMGATDSVLAFGPEGPLGHLPVKKKPCMFLRKAGG